MRKRFRLNPSAPTSQHVACDPVFNKPIANIQPAGVFVTSLSAMIQSPAHVLVCKFTFACVLFTTWSVAASAADAGVIRFVQAVPPGVPAPAAISETFSDAQITLAPTPNGVSIAGASWSLNLESTQARPFGPACYERARRASSTAASRPGLEFNYNGSTCNPIGGRYRVLEYQQDPGSHAVDKLAVDFYQYCGDFNHSITGNLRYHSAIPVDAESLTPVFSASGSVYVLGNSEYVTQGDNYTFAIDAFNTLAMPDASGSAILFNSQANAWQLSFAAPGAVPLLPGDYVSAQKTGYQEAGHPGLDYDMAARACTQISGDFNVDAITWDPVENFPTKFFATFTQSCEATSPPISGVIAYTASFESGPLVDDVIHLEGFDADKAWPLVWQCQ